MKLFNLPLVILLFTFGQSTVRCEVTDTKIKEFLYLINDQDAKAIDLSMSNNKIQLKDPYYNKQEALQLFKAKIIEAKSGSKSSQMWLIRQAIDNQCAGLYELLKMHGITAPVKQLGQIPDSLDGWANEFAELRLQSTNGISLTKTAPIFGNEMSPRFFPFRLKLLSIRPDKLDEKIKSFLVGIVNDKNSSELEQIHATMILARGGELAAKEKILQWSKDHQNGYVRFMCRDLLPELFKFDKERALKILEASKADPIVFVSGDSSLGNNVDNAIQRLKSIKQSEP